MSESWPYGGTPYFGATCDCCERTDVAVISFWDEDGSTLCQTCCEAIQESATFPAPSSSPAPADG